MYEPSAFSNQSNQDFEKTRIGSVSTFDLLYFETSDRELKPHLITLVQKGDY